MKHLAFIYLIITLISCKQKPTNYTYIILQQDSIHTSIIQKIDTPERALLSGYLFAYGNECLANSDKNKCEILKILQIDNECNTSHIDFLKSWFKNDAILQYKLQNCPNLPYNFAIQNSFDTIILKRDKDTVSISYGIKGLNNSQEKSWNVNKEDKFLIKNKTLIKLEVRS